MNELIEIRTHDMCGNEIHRLGETGYGVSLTHYQRGDGTGPKFPQFTLFHISDGFRQCLFMFEISDWERNKYGTHASTLNHFGERIEEVVRIINDELIQP